VLAGILRTDAHAHRPLPADTELVQAIAVLARVQQDAVWQRHQLANQLRLVLRGCFPAAVQTFCVKHVGLTDPQARALLATAPTPTLAERLSIPRLRALLRRAGRQRNLDRRARQLHASFRAEQAHQPPLIEQAMGQHVLALVGQLDAACQAADQLAAATISAFRRHASHPIITSQPGLGEPDRRADPGRGRRRLRPIYRPPGAQGLRRRRPDHPRQRQTPPGDHPPGEDPTTGRGRLASGRSLP